MISTLLNRLGGLILNCLRFQQFNFSHRLTQIVLLAIVSGLIGCRWHGAPSAPTIEFSQVPRADVGGPDKVEQIAGRVISAQADQRLVLFAKSGQWWVQPSANQPYTIIQAEGSWRNTIHLGVAYAALLVTPAYVPPTTMDALPTPGGSIVAIATVPGLGGAAAAVKAAPFDPKTFLFSGYEWEARQLPSSRGGTSNTYDPANVWTDAQGYLHLRIAKTDASGAAEFTCAEVKLQRSLGYGSYIFTVREVAHLEPAAVLGLYTWDDLNAEQNHREMDIEISRWGDPLSKNTQYAIQPYYVPVNMFRFTSPAGLLTYAFHWEPGRVSFYSFQGHGSRNHPSVTDPADTTAPVIAKHVFTSGVPSPGDETVHLSFYVYGKTRTPLQKEAEVVIEKFEYLP